jgi:mRNA interferase HigB
MIVTRLDRLIAFSAEHPPSVSALNSWRQTVEAADWKSPVQVRETYRTADVAVPISGGRKVAVFNIGGNKYRLIALIDYALGLVNVLHVLTHKEYDKNRWKE